MIQLLRIVCILSASSFKKASDLMQLQTAKRFPLTIKRVSLAVTISSLADLSAKEQQVNVSPFRLTIFTDDKKANLNQSENV